MAEPIANAGQDGEGPEAGSDNDLIVAIATAPGQAGIGVVRLSGKGALDVAHTLTGKTLTPRTAVFARLSTHGELIDEGLVIGFPAPHSFTGEDVVEFQLHGSPVVLQQCLDACCAHGARLARPGEFSERAFLNDKMDLVQAEAIADLIASASAQAARAARRSLQGEFSRRVHALAAETERLRLLTEATIDFPEEDEDFLAEYNVAEQLAQLQVSLDELLAQSRQGVVLQEGCTVALLGPPNAGKSSLLNALAGEEAAIVTDIPGTTRDLLKVDLVLEGLPVRLVDTAGLHVTSDTVEAIGIERAQVQVESADVVVVVLDATSDLDATRDEILRLAGIAPDDDRVLLLANKVDLLATATSKEPGEIEESEASDPLFISARLGTGLAEVRAALRTRAGLDANEPGFTARRRHVIALERCGQCLNSALTALKMGASTELVAEDLREAHTALGEIVGVVTADDLLGKIFSEFCIGK